VRGGLEKSGPLGRVVAKLCHGIRLRWSGDLGYVDSLAPLGYAYPMVGPAKKHVDELLKLSPDERSEAAELLLRSLEDVAETEDPSAVEAAWVSELERRVDQSEPGVPAETVFSDAHARLKRS
jgi:hypothetical protein